jgi:hypothetical protein
MSSTVSSFGKKAVSWVLEVKDLLTFDMSLKDAGID